MSSPVINLSLPLTLDQYYEAPRVKSLICLHHTVGGSATSTYGYWQGTPERVGTAYQIERDGTIYEHFPATAYAYQFGLRASVLTKGLVSQDDNLAIERRAIGIELSSEGALIERDGKLYAFPWREDRHQKLLGPVDTLVNEGRVVYYGNGWRGWKWFDAYDQPQIEAALALIEYLCARHNIPRQAPPMAEAFGPADVERWIDYQGIIHHAMLRPDKSDLHPAFPWTLLGATT